MHAVFFLVNSRHHNNELRFALRGIAAHCPFIQKVWIFGDRPDFLSPDLEAIEHVPHESLARIGKFKTPLKNFFLLTWISSLIPELTPGYLRFSDDTIVIAPLEPETACKQRYLENMDEVKVRGKGLWKESLWRTYDLLKRLGYPGYNFETHCPTFYTKRRVLEAYCAFKDFITQDRWQGMLGPTAILNHAYHREKFTLVQRDEEGLHAGFYEHGHGLDEIVMKCSGKTFLNFDDEAFDENMQQFLRTQFPQPCKFEA